MENFEVTVLISLRNPIDFLYSYYVELFRWYFYKHKELNTIEKYINKLIEDPNNEIFMVHFYDRFLEYLKKYFSNINIILYEDIKYDIEEYSNKLSLLLGVEKQLIKEIFSKNIRNTRQATHTGKKSEPVPLGEFLETKLNNIKRKTNIKILKKLPLVKKIYRYTIDYLNFLPYKSVEHRFLTDTEKNYLKSILLKNNSVLYMEFGISKDKLYNYEYIIPP